MQITYQKYFTFCENKVIMLSQISFKRSSISSATNRALKDAVFYLLLGTGQRQYLIFVVVVFKYKAATDHVLKNIKIKYESY